MFSNMIGILSFAQEYFSLLALLNYFGTRFYSNEGKLILYVNYPSSFCYKLDQTFSVLSLTAKTLKKIPLILDRRIYHTWAKNYVNKLFAMLFTPEAM